MWAWRDESVSHYFVSWTYHSGAEAACCELMQGGSLVRGQMRGSPPARAGRQRDGKTGSPATEDHCLTHAPGGSGRRAMGPSADLHALDTAPFVSASPLRCNGILFVSTLQHCNLTLRTRYLSEGHPFIHICTGDVRL